MLIFNLYFCAPVFRIDEDTAACDSQNLDCCELLWNTRGAANHGGTVLGAKVHDKFKQSSNRKSCFGCSRTSGSGSSNTCVLMVRLRFDHPAPVSFFEITIRALGSLAAQLQHSGDIHIYPWNIPKTWVCHYSLQNARNSHIPQLLKHKTPLYPRLMSHSGVCGYAQKNSASSYIPQRLAMADRKSSYFGV